MGTKQELFIYKKCIDELNTVTQDHKMLMMVHLYPAGYFVGRWVNLEDQHIQIAKRAFFDTVSNRLFGGCEPVFKDETAQQWWDGLNIGYFTKKYPQKLKPGKSGWNRELDYEDDLTKSPIYSLSKEYKMPNILFDLSA